MVRLVCIWPFITVELAKRNSVNRPKGTPETKLVNVTKPVSREMYQKKLTPAILEHKHHFSDDVSTQQDNATPHPAPNDKEMNEFFDGVKSASTGLNIRLKNQTPNSPDLNTLDLAFFRAIQSLQQEVASNSIDELIARVEKAYWDLPLETCEKVWVTLQMVMNEIIINGGNNGYRLPHMGKDKLMKEMKRKIPYRLPCPALVNPQQSLNGAYVKAWMQQLQAAEVMEAFANPVGGGVAMMVPQLPPLSVDDANVGDGEVEVELDESPTGVAEGAAVTAEQFQATAMAEAQRLDVDESHDDSMLTIDDDGEEPDDEDEEEAVEKDVHDASQIMRTFWATMEFDSWNNDDGEFDHEAIEGAANVPLLKEQEEPVMFGQLDNKNHRGQNNFEDEVIEEGHLRNLV